MIETDKLIYIQMQKTGCTRIGEIITQLCNGRSVGRKHGTLLSKPKNKFVIGSIRNPWEWYVSLWAFGCEGRGGVRSWFRGIPEWDKVYSDVSKPELFQQWLEMMYSAKYLRLMKNGYAEVKQHSCFEFGPMTWRYTYLYLAGVDVDRVPYFTSYDYDEFVEYERRHNMVNDHWVKLENLYFSLGWILISYGGLSTSDARVLMELCQQKTNVSKHLPYQKYYDDLSIEMVKNRERLIVEKFGYDFNR